MPPTSGPDLLIQTIEQDLGIPINHYVSVTSSVSGMVNALGGVAMDFRPGEGRYTGLDVTTTGCQVVNGTTALQLVQPAPLLQGLQRLLGVRRPVDFSRIQRQDAFFPRRAGQDGLVHHQPPHHQLLHRRGRRQPHHRRHPDARATSAHRQRLPRARRRTCVTETLPTDGYTTSGGADVLQGGAALRPERDRRLQPDRETPPKPEPKAPAKHASDHDDDVPTEAHSLVGVDVSTRRP